MKFIFVFCAVLHLSTSATLPNPLKKFSCSKSEAEFSECVANRFKTALPYIIKGSKELGLTPLDPWEISSVSTNRTISELVDLKSVTRNVKIVGLRNMVVEDIRANPTKNSFKLRLSIPSVYMEMSYEALGRLFIVINSKGFFQGNFTDTTIDVRGDLKLYKKENEEYFTTDNLNVSLHTENIHIKLTADNPDEQIAIDVIQKFVNENSQLALDAVNPIVSEVTTEVYRTLINRILSIKPAREWSS